MEILILGNGFEINFNKKLKNFNAGFQDWLISFSEKDEEEKLVKMIEDELNKSELDKISKELIKRSISHLVNEVKNIEIDETIEDLLYRLGLQLIESFSENNEFDKIMQVFSFYKILLGFYVNSITENACKKFDLENLDFLSDYKQPSYIFTTNYTTSAYTLGRQWGIKNRYLPIISTIVKPLHGSIINESQQNRFDNLQINLVNKESETHFKELLDFKNVKKFSFTIFGLSLINDNNILKNILNLAKSGKKISLIYNSFSEKDTKDFLNVLSLWMKEETDESKFDETNGVIYLYWWENNWRQEAEVDLTILNSCDNFLFLELKKLNIE